MKLSKIYSNYRDVFPAILFNDGLNVIFARVRDPYNRDKDSHNLGKTFLIYVIDFALLGSIDENHAFRKDEDIFGDFVFFLELQNNKGKYITIRRAVKPRTKVCINVSDTRLELSTLEPDSWTLPNLPIERAIRELNSFLNLDVLSPETYRKGLSYVLRRQSDYNDVFRTSKFTQGRDVYWKPFVSQLLGFDRTVVDKKYNLEEQIGALEKRRLLLEQESGSNSAAYDEIRGLVQIKETAAQKVREQLDNFSFQEVEAEINHRLVDQIETQISDLNTRRYTLDYQLREITESFANDAPFDFNSVRRVFDEAQIVMPENLVRSYEEVMAFNQLLSSRRSERLRETYDKLSKARAQVQSELERLDVERSRAVALLEQKETLVKYRRLQHLSVDRETEVAVLREQLAQLDMAANIESDKEALQQDLAVSIQQIREMIRGVNSTYSSIRTTFSDCVENVLNVQALMSVNVNKEGNLEFNVRTLDRDDEGRETSEALGTTYKKILCACFDLALIEVYSAMSFYRFAYHDGIFEGLDNRKKASLLQMVRKACDTFHIQYILTVIDSDLPRDERDNKEIFHVEEIVRELHDLDETGRLFRTRRF